MKWKQLEHNQVLDGDGFYISYNPTTCATKGVFADLGNMILDATDAIEQFTTGEEETALCKDGKFYILVGDWRKDYEKVVAKGFNACKKIYDKNCGEYDSIWSTDHNIIVLEAK